MKYLFLAYSDERQWEALTVYERDTFDEACFVNNEALQESGYLLAAADLQSSAATVRVHQGKVSLTDGPIARTSKQLVALFFINARDLNEAVQIAAKMPQAQRGPIEVRPMMV